VTTDWGIFSEIPLSQPWGPVGTGGRITVHVDKTAKQVIVK